MSSRGFTVTVTANTSALTLHGTQNLGAVREVLDGSSV
jgi:hypothetical protein